MRKEEPWNFRRPLIVNAAIATPLSALVLFAMASAPTPKVAFGLGVAIFLWLFGFALCVLLENSGKI